MKPLFISWKKPDLTKTKYDFIIRLKSLTEDHFMLSFELSITIQFFMQVENTEPTYIKRKEKNKKRSTKITKSKWWIIPYLLLYVLEASKSINYLLCVCAIIKRILRKLTVYLHYPHSNVSHTRNHDFK